MSNVQQFARDAFRYGTRLTGRNLAHWLVLGVALGLELAVALVISDGRVYDWEQELTQQIQDMPAGDLLFEFSDSLTNTWTPRFLTLVAFLVVAACLLRHWIVAGLFLLTLPLHLVGQFPKLFVDRDRPSRMFEGITGIGGPQAFPSGHSEFVITFYGLLTYVLVRHTRNRWLQGAVIAFWIGLVIATGLGRIAAGRHWPIDIVVGYAAGIGLLSALIWLYSALRMAYGRSTEPS